MSMTPLAITSLYGEGLIYLFEIEYVGDFYQTGVDELSLGTVAGPTVSDYKDFTVKGVPPGLEVSHERWGTEDVTFLTTDPERPNVWFEGRVINPGSFASSISLSSLDASSIVSEHGTITLENSDGGLDDLSDNNLLINARAQIRVGARGWDHSQYTVAMTGMIKSVDTGLREAQVTTKNFDSIVTEMFYSETYTGGGGTEGAADLAGARKPYVIGYVFNMAPTMIEPNTFIFQAHAGGPVSDFKVVRFGGVEMDFIGDYPDFATLEALVFGTDIRIGEYATCKAEGLIRAGLTQGGLGSFALTCNVVGAHYEAAENARMVIEKANADHGVTYNAASFDALVADLKGYRYGRVITTPVSYSEVLNGIMRNISAYWGANREGEVHAVYLRPPEEISTVSLSYDENDILDVDRVNLPEGFEWPHSERTIRFRPNWSVTSQLAAIVSNPRLSEEYLERTVINPVQYRSSLSPVPADTGLFWSSDAERLANRLLQLHGKQRQMYILSFPITASAPALTSKVVVTYPRFGLKGGRDMIVVATREDYQNGTVQVTVWG